MQAHISGALLHSVSVFGVLPQSCVHCQDNACTVAVLDLTGSRNMRGALVPYLLRIGFGKSRRLTLHLALWLCDFEDILATLNRHTPYFLLSLPLLETLGSRPSKGTGMLCAEFLHCLSR